MRLDWLHEHDAVPWRMFRVLVRKAQGLYRWPGKPWLRANVPRWIPRLTPWRAARRRNHS